LRATHRSQANELLLSAASAWEIALKYDIEVVAA
jgi:PIN domain nuclease of toxin-antitoxin system